MQKASLRLSVTDQEKEMDESDYHKRAHLPDFNQTHTPTSSRKDVCTPFLPLKWLNPCLMHKNSLAAPKKQRSSRNPVSETHCQLQKKVSLNFLKTY